MGRPTMRPMPPPYTPPTYTDTGFEQDGRIRFPPWRGEADAPGAPPPAPMPPEDRIGFAIVGLGRLTLEQLLPAFAQSKKAKVTALVSGSPDKLKLVAQQYGIPPSACHSYEAFEQLAGNDDVQCVYIVLPNAMHREFTERAATIGKHVLCEKPLATSSADACAMVEACEAAGVRLMTAYRIHYQPHNLKVREWVRSKEYGRITALSCTNVQTSHPTAHEQWRHKLAMAGGGALPDIGLYCLNTARFISGEEPTEVMAWMHSPPGDPRFAEVEASMAFMLRMPSGLVVNCQTSYDARDDKHQRINLERATIDMPSAYAYNGQRLIVGKREGDDTSNTEWQLQPANQFAAEIDHMAECILEDKAPRTPGEEGVRDHVLMEALYESAGTGQPVQCPPPLTCHPPQDR
ncbi:MAG: Gfo/Idh/MocA family oxidoreductase [Comamonadaceae bacterium]|nr:MAG: Gfo/Idh/MocA family oxidoreductase [Comamonadaceae bacterium]